MSNPLEALKSELVDNAISRVEQMAPFTALAKADPIFTTSLVAVGNGEFLAVKALSCGG